MASGAHSGKSLTVALGSVTFHARNFRYTEGAELVDVTNEDSAGKHEVVVGLTNLITGTASGYCDQTTAPSRPTGAVLCTLFDGAATKTFSAYIQEMEVSVEVTGAAEVTFNFTEAQ